MRELFDLRGGFFELNGGWFEDDPYPIWRELRDAGPSTKAPSTSCRALERPAFFHGLPYPELPHFSVFTYEACDAAYRDPRCSPRRPMADDFDRGSVSALNTMLSMDGDQHRRYRSLVQPSFVPTKAQWWIRNWIEQTVHLLIDHFEGAGRAELNVDFCAAIPVLTITGSFGVPVEQALDIREALHQPADLVEMIKPIVAARREAPQDDLISVLVEAEIKDEDGTTQRLSDPEIYLVRRSCSSPPGRAPRGSRWASRSPPSCSDPRSCDAVTADREPAAPGHRGVAPLDADRSDVLALGHRGHRLLRHPHRPRARSCTSASARPTATRSRWDDPDEYDIHRAMKPSLVLRQRRAHLPRHARGAGRDARRHRRAPRPAAQPAARSRSGDRPAIVGFYERGASAIPVLFG